MPTLDALLADALTPLKGEDCAILLSGGVDSLSVGFAAHNIASSITAYSFHLQDTPSYDYTKSQEVAAHMGWTFVGVEVPTDDLVQDFHRLLEFGCEKKTHFECSFPFLYTYPAIQQTIVLSGWGADGYYGLSRSAIQKWDVKENKESLDAFRDDYFQPHKCAGYAVHNGIAGHYDKTFIAPYLDASVRDFFYQFDWYELNKPQQKNHARNAFPSFAEIGLVEDHINLQLGASIPALFETLLDDRDINWLRRTRMLDVYKDWVKKYKRYGGSPATLDEFFT